MFEICHDVIDDVKTWLTVWPVGVKPEDLTKFLSALPPGLVMVHMERDGDLIFTEWV